MKKELSCPWDNGRELQLQGPYFMDSQFVVLDEPTAAMDPVAENEVYYNISKTDER